MNQQCAEVAKWSKAAASRAALAGVRGFKSLPPHTLSSYHFNPCRYRRFLYKASEVAGIASAGAAIAMGASTGVDTIVRHTPPSLSV